MLRRRRTLPVLFGLAMTYAVLFNEENIQDWITATRNSMLSVVSEPKSAPFYPRNADCGSKGNVLLLKTHKTGSSTVQNILLRYADEHKLRLALPTKNNYFGHPEPFDRTMLYSNQGPSRSTHASSSIENNIFAFHARYNYEEMKAVMPPDTIFITVLREPVKLMESLIIYYNLPLVYHAESPIRFMESFFSKNSTVSSNHATDTERFKGKYGRNQMSFDLGMHKSGFDDIDSVTNLIESVDSQFHLVMIAERMDESLILLQHLLCWTLDDIIAFPQNARQNTSMDQMSGDLKERIRYYNKADQLLYEHFSAKLDRQVKEFGEEEMKKQVSNLRDATQSMYEECVGKAVAKNLNFAPVYSKVKVNVVRYKPKLGTNKTCELLTVPELEHLSRLRKKLEENVRVRVPLSKKKSNFISSAAIKHLMRLN